MGFILIAIGGYKIFKAPGFAKPQSELLVSIKPLHSIVCNLMEGILTPELLLTNEASTHHFNLKPSQINAATKAKLIIWVGNCMEGQLVKTLKQFSNKLFTVESMSNFHLLTLRLNNIFELTAHSQKHGQNNESQACSSCTATKNNHTLAKQNGVHNQHNEHNQQPLKVYDGHFWLDPNYVIRLIPMLEAQLIKIWPQHAKQIKINTANMGDRLKALNLKLITQLKHIKNVKYILFHDSNQYFDHAFGSNAVATLLIGHGQQLSLSAIKQVKTLIASQKIKYLVIPDNLASTETSKLSKLLNLKILMVDEEGNNFKAGPNAYFELMEAMGNQMASLNL